MINQSKVSYTEQYKTNIAFFFLLSFLFFQPLLKYFEYVLDFPRINFSLIVVFLFFMYLLSIHTMIVKYYQIDLLLSFWLILFISGIQILSMPWAIHYSMNGFVTFLKIISTTFFCYWMFWFSGLHIKQILNSEKAKFVFNISWALSMLMILFNALSNDSFKIILDGSNIYLMLADCFAVLSILVLIYNKKFDIWILLLSTLCLFALLSRASLYSFIFISTLYMLKEHKIKLLMLFFIAIFFMDQLFLIRDDRMLRLLFGSFDASQSLRDKWQLFGLKDIRLTWLFGKFMGDVDSSYGNVGTYIHSFLSLIRQFGIIVFLSFIALIISYYYKIIKLWLNNLNNRTRHVNFLFYFTTFVLIEIVFARSYVHPFIWMSLSSVQILNLKNE